MINFIFDLVHDFCNELNHPILYISKYKLFYENKEKCCH